jgi:uncharacterized cupin superfamily protein
VLRRASFLSDSFEYDPSDPDGYRSGQIHVTKALGAEALAVKVFEIPPGESLCPYHYEYEEEWLVVLDGEVNVRTPDGEETLQRGEIAQFPPGAAGSHKVSNGGERTDHDVLERTRACCGRVSGQRQDRRLAGEPRRPGDLAPSRRCRGLLRR